MNKKGYYEVRQEIRSVCEISGCVKKQKKLEKWKKHIENQEINILVHDDGCNGYWWRTVRIQS